MLLNIYIFYWLHILGVIYDSTLNLSHGVSLDDLYEKHFYASTSVHSSYILVCDIESLENWVVVAMVMWILGSSKPHNISGGQLQMVGHVLRETYFGWAHMYLNQV